MSVLLLILGIALAISLTINVIVYFYTSNLLVETREVREDIHEVLSEQMLLLDTLNRLGLDISIPSYAKVLNACRALQERNAYYLSVLKEDLGVLPNGEEEQG